MAMEINGLNSSQTKAAQTRNGQAVAAPKNGPAEATDKAAGGADTVQISTQGKALNRLQNQMGKEPTVNRAKVEALKTAIANGTYKPDAESIAKRMLESDQLF